MNIKGILCCEESQAVTKEFRRLGIEVYSNDLKDCSGGHPEWHIKGDAFDAIKQVNPLFMIAHPPCTHIAVSGAKHFKQKLRDGRQQAGIELFLKFTQTGIKHTCLENPISIMSDIYKKPTQIIEPYFFGDTAKKATCLWLEGLPPLFHASKPDLFNQEVTHVDKGEFVIYGGKKFPKWYMDMPADENRGAIRSVTFPGIARAMAIQWTDYLLNKYAA